MGSKQAIGVLYVCISIMRWIDRVFVNRHEARKPVYLVACSAELEVFNC